MQEGKGDCGDVVPSGRQQRADVACAPFFAALLLPLGPPSPFWVTQSGDLVASRAPYTGSAKNN